MNIPSGLGREKRCRGYKDPTYMHHTPSGGRILPGHAVGRRYRGACLQVTPRLAEAGSAGKLALGGWRVLYLCSVSLGRPPLNKFILNIGYLQARGQIDHVQFPFKIPRSVDSKYRTYWPVSQFI
ncbi:hypothetical protein AAG570_006405 [Ranatra chinensis]|uniref:Uncharacterized protein n=1 Tax=Ranatra chinensis TaxID=642074 RepID=A0ABD0YTZ2_9HEMI